MKVLIGVDGSPFSFAAVQAIGHLLLPTDEVALYHSCGDAPLNDADDATMQNRACEAIANVVFDEAKKHLPEHFQSQAHTIVGTERPADELIAAAGQWGADLIVVGARGLGRMETMLLGSVSSAVVRTSPIPVLVVRHGHALSPETPLKVLLAYDATNADAQSEILQNINWPAGVAGQVMVVIESLLPSHLPQWVRDRARDADTEAMTQAWVSEHESERQTSVTELTTYQQKLPAGFQSPPIVAEGNPTEQLLAAITREKIDVVVVGKSVKSRLSRMLLGSTSEKILAYAPCSVLVVPRASGG
ncbi:MAG: universal stress protein [Planctomycetota bacterium]|nr:universal stress protein [Planctomycetota bacterium]